MIDKNSFRPSDTYASNLKKQQLLNAERKPPTTVVKNLGFEAIGKGMTEKDLNMVLASPKSAEGGNKRARIAPITALMQAQTEDLRNCLKS